MKKYTYHNSEYGTPEMEPEARDCEQFYLDSDVDAAVNALVESQEFHERLMDYRAAGYPRVSDDFKAIKTLVRNSLMESKA